MRAGTVVAMLFVAGCCTPGPSGTPSASSDPPSAPAPAPRGRRAEPLLVWVIGGILEPRTHGPELWVTTHVVQDVDAERRPRDVLRVSGGRIVGGAEALRPVLRAWPHGATPVVAFENLVPYATVSDFLATARQEGFGDALLLLLQEGRQAGARVRLASTPPAPRTGLALTVTLRSTGAIISSAEGPFAPGCDSVVPGSIAVPGTPNAEPPVMAISSCVRRVKQAHPSEDTVELVAEPDVAFSLIARTIVVLQGTPDQRLFPTITVGALP